LFPRFGISQRHFHQVLLDAKVDVTSANDKGETPLSAAKAKGHAEVIALLEAYEAQEVEVSPFIASSNGRADVIKVSAAMKEVHVERE